MMPWFRVDDGSAFNAKVLAAGNEAWGAFCRVGAHCAQQLTDGHFSRALALTIAPKRIWERLIEVGLVDAIDKGGMVIHDYLQRNPSKEQVTAERQAAKDRMMRVRSPGVRPNRDRTNGCSSPSPSHPIPSHPDPEGDARASERRLKSVPPPPPEPSEAMAPAMRATSDRSGDAATRKGAEAGAVASGDSERPVELAERIWHELWEAKYRRPYEHTGKYAFGPQSEDQVLVRIAEKASIRQGGAEAYLRHKIAAYLKDHGNRGWLDEHCHPLRCLEHDWVAYGEPKEPKRLVPRREEPELLSIDEMAARAAAAMTLKIGNGGT